MFSNNDDGEVTTGAGVVLSVRPALSRPGEHIEESIAKIRHLPGLGVWRIFWKRADGNWHRYLTPSEVGTLAEALQIIDKDTNGCFFG